MVEDGGPEQGAPAPGKRRGEITTLLVAARNGVPGATERLFSLVYKDLRALAACHVRGATRGPSATSLVHQAFLRFARQGPLPYEDRTHLLAVASRAMRQILIDEARARRSAKRGSGAPVTPLEEGTVSLSLGRPADDLLLVDEALGGLERQDPRLARVAEWHVFGGLTFGEIADVLAVSERTVLRDRRAARALLHVRLAPGATTRADNT